MPLRFLPRLVPVLAACLALAGAAHAQLPDRVRFGVVVEAGQIDTVRKWLDQGLHPDFVADRIGTGLMIAAWEGNIELMALFVERGARINLTNAYGEQAVLHAAWRGKTDAVKWLLDRGAQINRPGLAWSALHYAVFSGNRETTELLVKRGANVNARSTNGSTPLMMAAREGRDELAKYLLAIGADPSVRNDAGEDAFVWAMRNGHKSIAKLVGSPERFAEAERLPPEALGPVTRSNPVPQRIDQLIEEMRRAAAEQRLTPDLQAAYLQAVRALRQASASAPAGAGRDEAPAALEIRARREQPGAEQAVLVYEGRKAVDAFFGSHPGFGAAPAPGAGASESTPYRAPGEAGTVAAP